MGAERRVMGPEEVTKDVWKDGGKQTGFQKATKGQEACSTERMARDCRLEA
jgi:hypothetical protein